MELPTFSKARGRLAIRFPFYATGMMGLQTVWTDRVDIAATDMIHMFLNPKALAELDVEELMMIIAHETLHFLLKHAVRRGSRNPDLWNGACDYAINGMLIKAGFKMPRFGGLYDPKYDGMSAEQIYEAMREDADNQGGSSGAGDGNRDGDGAPSWGSDIEYPDALGDPGERERISRRATEALTQAVTLARAAGKLPADLEALVDEVLDPAVPWEDLLRDYMTRTCADDESWMHRNRRFSDIYLPSRRSVRMGPIVFVPDTSGSMWCGDTLQTICSEIAHCQQQLNPESIRVVWADTRVAGEQVFDGDDFSFDQLKPQGGGGTDMRVPLAYVEQFEPQIVILYTDGETPWPDAPPPYDLITLCTTDQPVPFGEVLRVHT